MSGRPPSSYFLPRIWLHVERMGYHPSERALKLLRAGFNPPHGTRLSNSFFETKFKPAQPKLCDYATAHAMVALLNHKRDGDPLAPAEEIVQFCWRLVPNGHLVGQRTSEHADMAGDLAEAAGLGEDIVADAFAGRLLPHAVCERLAAASNNQFMIQNVSPGRNAAPASGVRTLLGIRDFYERP